MKTKKLTVLAAVVALAAAANSAHAVQKHDPQFQSPYVIDSAKDDPNLTSAVRHQSGSPKAKPDLYVARSVNTGTDRDLVRNVRYMAGSPKAKTDRLFELAPLK